MTTVLTTNSTKERVKTLQTFLLNQIVEYNLVKIMTWSCFQTRMKLIETWINCRLNRSLDHRTLNQSLNRTLGSSAVLWARRRSHRPTRMQHRRRPPHQSGPLHGLGLDPDLDHASQTSSEHLNIGIAQFMECSNQFGTQTVVSHCSFGFALSQHHAHRRA